MLPPFEVAGGLPLAVARGLSVAGLLSTFGALLARVVIMPPVLSRLTPQEAARAEHAHRRLVQTGLALAALASAAWVWLVAGTLAETDALSDIAATAWVVLAHTLFGHVVMLRLAALALVALLLRGPMLVSATCVAGAAVVLQSLHSHAASMSDGVVSWLLLSDVLHLLAAGAWLGGLLPLLLVVRLAPPQVASAGCRRFSWLGGICVLVLATTASYQAWVLIGGVPGLVGTAYGLTALVKLALFACLLGLAALNRLRLAPSLAHDSPLRARRRLARSIGVETVLGLCVILAAGVLTSQAPSMHVQPVWPFALRPSLAAVQEDADFRREVIGAALALGGSVALLALAFVVRDRVRWLVVLAAAVIAWFAAPHLDLLLVPAYPTSYQHSPTRFAAAAIVRGSELFPRHCASCHGATGRGDGPAARTLTLPPADLTAQHLWMHSDGELIWWLSHGMQAPEGGVAMPGFANVLAEDDLWDLIDYLHAHNAGLIQRDTGRWSVPIRAPGFQANCAGRSTQVPQDLQGRIIRLVIGRSPHPSKEQPGIVTILVTPDPPAQRGPGDCTAKDATVARAFAISAGRTPQEVDGAQFLIDGDGWLRAMQPAGTQPGWNDWRLLARATDALRAHPIAGMENGPGQMHM